MVNLLLKINERRDRRPNCVIFVVWSALIVSDRVVVSWRRKFRVGWNLAFCVPGLTREWGTQGESKILSICFWCKAGEQRFWVQEGGFKIFSRGPRDGKILPKSSASFWNKEYALVEGCVEVCVEFVVAGTAYKISKYWIFSGP